MTVGITSHNSAAYVDTCLRSVALQSLGAQAIEVIVVDDGSTDNTIRLLNAHLAAFPAGHLRVLRQRNSGSPSRGRNRILHEAKGEYVHFLDVDDYLGPDALRAMVERGDRNDSDIVIGRYVGVNRSVPSYIFRSNRERTSVTELSLLDSMNVLKMFRTAYLRRIGVRFNERSRFAEDHQVSMQAYLYTDKVSIEADTECYFWVQHTSREATQGHLTGHLRSVRESYAYMWETLGIIPQAGWLRRVAKSCPRLGAVAPLVRQQYWKRLLTFDLVTEMRRDRDEHERRASIQQAQRLLLVEGRDLDFAALPKRGRDLALALATGDPSGVFKVVDPG